MSFFLLAGFQITVQVVSTASPSAMKATTGTGLHKSRVYWINWDINNDKNPYDDLTSGVSATFTSPAGFVYVGNYVFNSGAIEITEHN